MIGLTKRYFLLSLIILPAVGIAGGLTYEDCKELGNYNQLNCNESSADISSLECLKKKHSIEITCYESTCATLEFSPGLPFGLNLANDKEKQMVGCPSEQYISDLKRSKSQIGIMIASGRTSKPGSLSGVPGNLNPSEVEECVLDGVVDRSSFNSDDSNKNAEAVQACRSYLARSDSLEEALGGSSAAARAVEAEVASVCQNKNDEPMCETARALVNECKAGGNEAERACVEASKLASKVEDKNRNTADNTDDSPSGGGYCNMKTLVELQKECNDARKEAVNCCNSGALGCLMPGGGSGGAASAVGAVAMGLLSNPSSLAQECDSFKTMGTLSAGLNGAMAGACQMKRNSCDDACTSRVQTEILQLKNRYANDKNCLNEINGQERLAENRQASCDRLMSNQVMMAGQAAQSLMANQFAELCKSTVTPITPPVPPPVANDWCRSAKDLSNPYCVQILCQQPAYAGNPLCQGDGSGIAQKPTDTNNGNNGSFSGGGDFGSRSADADVEGLGDDSIQGFQGAKFEPGESSANVAQGGGGSGLPGGAGGGGQGDFGAGGGGAGGGKGFDTDVLKGLSSGSGYSVSGAGKLGGGGGYSATNANNKKAGKAFNLNDFLPGKKKGRNIAGLAKAGPMAQLAGKHDSLFIRVSNKYKEMCHLNKLYCEDSKNGGRRSPNGRR